MRKFKENDIFRNRIKTHPKYEFFVHSGTTYLNNYLAQGSNIPQGSISLYEENIDRTAAQKIYPFIIKTGNLTSFSTVSTSKYNEYAYGTTITGSYPLTSSIKITNHAPNSSRPYINALKNTINYYGYLSPHCSYSSTLGDYSTVQVSEIQLSSIFYGSSIKKGTVALKFYTSGAVLNELYDNERGELVQASGSQSGSVAGVILYTEGIMLLTGSWALATNHSEPYYNSTNYNPSWKYFGASVPSSSYGVEFEGINYVDVITMYCHAPPGELNHSNNATYIEHGQTEFYTSGSKTFSENQKLSIKNIVKSPFDGAEADFEKTVYISKIAVLDQYGEILGIAKLATPIKKEESRGLSFKLKLDI